MARLRLCAPARICCFAFASPLLISLSLSSSPSDSLFFISLPFLLFSLRHFHGSASYHPFTNAPSPPGGPRPNLLPPESPSFPGPWDAASAFAAILELSMIPSSLDPDAKKVDPRTLMTVFLQYARVRHAVDLAESTFYSVALGGAISLGGDLDARSAQLMQACSLVGGRDPEPVAEGGGGLGAIGAGGGPLAAPPSASLSAPSTSASPAAATSHPTSILEAAARAAGPWPLGRPLPGFPPVVQPGVASGMAGPHPFALCPVCCGRSHDPHYRVSMIADGCHLGQLGGTALASRCGAPSIRTFAADAHDRSEKEALSAAPPPEEPHCHDDCTVRYPCVQGAPSRPDGPPRIQVVISSACLHGGAAFNGTVASYLYENFRDYRRIFADFGRVLPLNIEAFNLDIVCHFWNGFLQKFPPGLAPDMRGVVPPFHSEGHVRKCKAKFGSQAQLGLGRECVEHEEQWREIQLRIGHSLKYMSTDRFIDLLQLCMFQMALEKRVDIFDLLVVRNARMVKLDGILSARKAQLLSDAVTYLRSEAPPPGAGAGAGEGGGALDVWAVAALLNNLADDLTACDLVGGPNPASLVLSKIQRFCLARLVYEVAAAAQRSTGAEALFGGDRSQAAIDKATREYSQATLSVNSDISVRVIAGSDRTWASASLAELLADPDFSLFATEAVRLRVVEIEVSIQRLACEYAFLNSQIQEAKLTPDQASHSGGECGRRALHVKL